MWWFVAVVSSAQAGSWKAEQGSGRVGSEVRAAGTFHRVVSTGAVGVRISLADAPAVEVHGEDNLLDNVRTTLEDGVLTIEAVQAFSSKEPLYVVVRAVELDAVSLDGAVSAEIDGFRGEKLELTLAGAVTLHATGAVGSLVVSTSGAGAAHLSELAARSAVVSTTGAGTVRVTATEELDATAAGASTILYRGRPSSVHAVASGVSTVRPE